MAEYEPPKETLPIFDPAVFATGDEPLTYNIAVKKFLKYPSAQGTENLQAINVNGISTFNAAANFNKPIVMSSATVADREIESSTYTVLNASNTDIGSVSYTSNSILYNSKINSGRQVFNNTTSLGVNLEVMAMTADAGVTMTRPLVMTGTSLNRAITSSSYKMLSGANVLSGEIAMSGSDQIYYQNTVTSGNHTFLTRNSGGTQTTPLKITSSAIDVNTIMNINNGSIPYGLIGISAPNEIRLQNNINEGSIGFLVRNSVGTIITPLLLNSNGLIMTASGNYIQFPDGTQQTTAATSTPVKTYTEYVVSQPPDLSNKMVTIPPNCYEIDIVAIGSGGLAGAKNETPFFPGGAGGGGAIAKTTAKIVVSPGQQFNIIFSTDASGNFITGNTNGANNNILIRSPNAREAGDAAATSLIPINGVNQSRTNVIGVLKNGLNGGTATAGAPGAAALGGTSPVFNTFATNWNVQPSTAGYIGGTLVDGQNIAGAPKGSRWLAGGYGSGQVSPDLVPGSLAGNAVVMFTYYIG